MFQKVSLLYCDNLVRCYPILLISAGNISQEICSKTRVYSPPHLVVCVGVIHCKNSNDFMAFSALEIVAQKARWNHCLLLQICGHRTVRPESGADYKICVMILCSSMSSTRRSISGMDEDGCAPVWELTGDTSSICFDTLNCLLVGLLLDSCTMWLLDFY